MTTETTPCKKRTYIYLRMSQLFKSVQYAYRSKHFLRLNEGDIGVCGIAVLDNFSCGISVILFSKCGIAVFSEPAGYGFLAFRTVLKIILQVLRRFPSLFQFPIGHSQ